MDKIEEIKKLLWILDSKHNVSIPQTKENIDYIADEIVKLFAIPDVVGRSEQLVICKKCGSYEMYQYAKTKDKCEECGNIQDY